jgi:acetoin utilization protein AcuB
MRNIKLQEIMTKSVVSVGETDSLKTIREIFSHAHFHHLLVIDGDRLLGVISDRDLLRAMSPRIDTPEETLEDTATLDKTAFEIMTQNPIVLAYDATIGDAVEVFNRNRISCIPIVDHSRKPVGIISWRDIIRAIPH